MRRPEHRGSSVAGGGGGSELAMACEVVSQPGEAIFGQPRLGLVSIPGLGGAYGALALMGGTSRAVEIVSVRMTTTRPGGTSVGSTSPTGADTRRLRRNFVRTCLVIR